MPRGRKPKSSDQHQLHGTTRADRQAGSSPAAGGKPERPRTLKGEARKLWDFVVDELTASGTAKKIDTAMLVSMCEFYDLYRKALKDAQKWPLDKETRCALTAYWDRFEKISKQFGLSPEARARLKIEGPKPKGVAARKRR